VCHPLVSHALDIALGSGADLPSDDDITTALIKASFTASDALTLDASWQRFENTALEPNNGQGEALSTDPILGAHVVKDISSDTFRLGAQFNPAANDLIDARLTLYRTDSSVDEFDASRARTTLRDIETTGLSVRNAARFAFGDSEAIITVGGDWYRDEQVGRDDTATDGGRDGVPDGEQEFYGVFAQAELSLDQPLGLPGDLLIIPGVRYDHFENASDGQAGITDDAVSPRLAASYGPNDWLRVFASYSEGFRAPSINELYLDGVHFEIPHPILFNPGTGSFVFAPNNFIANPDLVPEKSTTTEFGAGVDFRDLLTSHDRFQAKASYYQSDVENLINLSVDVTFEDSCFTPPFFLPCTSGTTNAANLDNGELSGFELEATYDNDRIRARASFATVEGEDTATGADLGTLTPDRFSLDVRLKLPEWNAAAGVRLQVASDFERNESDGAGGLIIAETRDGYSVVDVYATWRPAFVNGLRFDVGVNNVFDEHYERVFAGVSEPGINPRIAISYQITR